MKNIKDLHVSQVRIFPEGTIPYEVLSLPDRLKQLKDRYHFGGEEIPFPLHMPNAPKLMIFQMGETKIEDKSTIIDRLQFEGRKMVLGVAASSSIANSVFLDIARLINEMAGDELVSEEKALIKTEETRCNVSLEIDYWDVFSDKMKRFVSDILPKTFDRPVAATNPNKLAFEIIFEQDFALFQKQKIHLVPKPLTIEPREGVPFDEHVFFTCSPFDSEAHLRLIEAFESNFQKLE
jgi:hypothetical protein